MSSENENYYEQESFNTMECVTLAEDIIFDHIHDLIGKFYFDAMMPNEPNTVSDRNYGTYTKSSVIELKIPAYLLLSFMQDNKLETIADHHSHHTTYTEILKHYGNVTSNRYVLTFPKDKYKIPAGTQFLVLILEGYMEIENICIIGVR